MKKRRFKTGAASFYIVTIATLLLTIISISFATVVISEVRRTANSDLSQSAYDSALAGIEDAKVAYLNYQSCLNQGYSAEKPANPDNPGNVTCGNIIWYMENPGCDMVAHMLGRTIFTNPDNKDEKWGVLIEESNKGNDKMQQYYTCTKINTKLNDYRGSINAANPSRVVQVGLEDGVSNITSIRLSWYSDNDGTDYVYSNFKNGQVVFPSLKSSEAATPPTISIQLIQTAIGFTLDQLEMSKNDETDRGTLFLVPTSAEVTGGTDTYISAHHADGTGNHIDKSAFVKSNDKSSENLPYAVHCPINSGSEFACSTSIELPSPIGGARSADTFMFVVSLPYGTPDTDFAIEFCNSVGICEEQSFDSGSGGTGNHVTLKGSQISIDSTGRANDSFRRVETRIDTTDTFYTYPAYAIQLTDDKNSSNIIKNIHTTCEYNFGGPTC